MLPQGYKRLEYIHTEAAGYIDTGISLSSFKDKTDSRIVMKLAWTNFTKTSNFQVNGWGNNPQIGIYRVDDTTYYWQNYNTGYGQPVIRNQIYTATLDLSGTYGVLKVPGFTDVTTSGVIGWSSSSFTIGHFTSAEFNPCENIYEVQIYQNGLIRNFIPAERVSDSAIGMYDTVTETFYASTGGVMTAGPYAYNIYNIKKSHYKKPSKVPSEYTELEYLQSSGTQKIDLNISGNTRAIIDAQCESNAHTLLSSTAAADAGSWIGSYSNKDYWTVGSSIFFTIPKTTRSVIDATFSDSGVTATIGSETKTNTQTITQGNWTLFACNSMLFTFTGKVWSCKMYQNDILVCNLIPARRNSDSVLGMYDTVTGTFFTNAGTGEFIAGPRVNLPDQYEELEYLKKSGNGNLAYIDTGFYQQVGHTITYKLKYNIISSFSTSFSLFGAEMFGFGVPDGGLYHIAWSDLRDTLAGGGSIRVCGRADKNVLRTVTYTGVATQTNAYSDFFGTPRRSDNKQPFENYIPPVLLYNFQISDNGTLVRNFIPVKRYSDGVLGMYDKCNSGKNLFDKTASSLNGYVDANNGEIKSASNDQVSIILRLKPNTTYTISGSTSTIGLFTTLPTIGSIASHFYTDTIRTFTTGANETYAVTILKWASGDWSNVGQIEEGSSATAYEPFPFYTNAGTGTFTAGPSIDNNITIKKSYYAKKILPDGYKELEYITTVNANQALDTEYIPNSDDNFEYKGIKKPAFSLFGTAAGGTYNFTGVSGNTHQFRVGSNNNVITMDAALHTVKVIDADVYVDGVKTADTITRLTPAVFMTYSIALFGRNRGTSVDDGTTGQALYYIKFFDKSGNLKFHAIPCINPDGVIGMYDVVAGKFLNRAGTDTTTPFTAGPEKTSYNIYEIKKSNFFIGG